MTRRGITKTVLLNFPLAVVAAILVWLQPSAVAQQPSSFANRIGFVWDANSETDLAGYLVIVRSPGGSVTNVVKAPNSRCEFDPLPALPLPWTVVVHAFNTAGLLSDPSIPLTIKVPSQPAGVRVAISVEVNVSQGEATVPMRTGTVRQDGQSARQIP